MGVSYQQALADYIAEDLGGRITAADYPAGGDNRITTVVAEPAPRTVTVKPGDYLRKLARLHLGTETRWPEIYELNRGRVQADGRSLRNPDLILVGWVLELPAS
ncbi:MAG: LysM peptidoglycan-binding domain-containing protein [Acidimicrobiaceae bacterium]|nr:LysM peptidoglycan-binding domain-containing protein [Acidimicrobiaceae bacterium]